MLLLHLNVSPDSVVVADPHPPKQMDSHQAASNLQYLGP